MMNPSRHWTIGEWVKGKTKDGEMIHGFIEGIDSEHDTVRVRVVESDHHVAVGKSVVTLGQWLRPFASSNIDAQGQIRDLIDLALATRDREWFLELTGIKAQLEKSSPGRDTRAGSKHVRNRLGTSAIWE